MRSADRRRALVLVLSDSLAFVGPRMPHPVDDARLWPNVMAEKLGADVEIFGDFGWTSRDAWYALGHDPRLWAVLPRVDAVVLALGSFDSAPAPLPVSLWKRIELIRSHRVRWFVSAVHQRAVPRLVRLCSHLPGDGPVVLRPRLTAHYLQGSLTLLRRKRRAVPVVGMTPIVVPANLARLHTGREATERAIRGWAAGADVVLLDLPTVVGEHMRSGRGNPDGMHMGWEGHEALGAAVADLLAGVLPDRAASRADSATDIPAKRNGAVPLGGVPAQSQPPQRVIGRAP